MHTIGENKNNKYDFYNLYGADNYKISKEYGKNENVYIKIEPSDNCKTRLPESDNEFLIENGALAIKVGGGLNYKINLKNDNEIIKYNKMIQSLNSKSDKLKKTLDVFELGVSFILVTMMIMGSAKVSSFYAIIISLFLGVKLLGPLKRLLLHLLIFKRTSK